MRNILLHIVLFSLLAVGVLILITNYTDDKLRARSKGRMMAWYNVAQGTINADILIIGNSHAHVQVNPVILATAFPGKRVYNLGLDGYSFDLQLARYRFYRRHNKKPQALVLCIDYAFFSQSKWEVDNVQFLPYLSDPAISDGLQRIGFSPLKCYLPFLKYSGQGNAVRAAMTNASPLPNDDTGLAISAGFEPRAYRWDEYKFLHDKRYLDSTAPRVDSAVWKSFLDFTETCRREGIAIYAILTPHHDRYLKHVTGADSYAVWLRKNIEKKARFFDFSQAAFAADTALFYNGTHLNEKGADVFSAALADSLLMKP